MKIINLLLGLSLLALAACGPLIGGAMVSGGGVKDVDVTSGSLADLKPGSRVAVLGPFAITDQAFHICSGEDAAYFSGAFNRSGLFTSTLKINERFPAQYPAVSSFKGKSAGQIQSELGLEQAPELLLSGVIMSREMVTAPAQGVMMRVRFKLDFLNVSTGSLVTVELESNDLFEKCIPGMVAELQERIVSAK